MKFTNITEQLFSVWGDPIYRNKNCPTETAEQISFFNVIRERYPDTHGRIALHPKNEGVRTIEQAIFEKVKGLNVGASDIVIGPFFCELKRQDRTLSRVTDEQVQFLNAAAKLGYYACLCFGAVAALRAFEDFLENHQKKWNE